MCFNVYTIFSTSFQTLAMSNILYATISVIVFILVCDVVNVNSYGYKEGGGGSGGGGGGGGGHHNGGGIGIVLINGGEFFL